MRSPVPPPSGFRQPDETVGLRSFAFQRLSGIAAVLDDTGLIVDVNDAWRLFALLNDGQPRDAGPGINYLGVCDRSAEAGSDDAMLVAIGLRAVLAGARDRFDMAYACHSPSEDRWFRVSAAAAPVANGAGLVVFHDITERTETDILLGEAPDRAVLLGPPDRRRAVGSLVAGLTGTGRIEHPVTVLLIELDGFTDITDEFGHAVGDRVLNQVESRARRATRDGDRLHRMGADQLAVVCSSLEPDDARAMAGRLRDSLARPYQCDALELVISVSTGVATSGGASTVDSLFDAADARLAADRNRARRHAGHHRADRRRARMAPMPTRRADPGPESLGPRGDEAELHAARAMTEAIVAHSGEVVMLLQPDGTIEWASPAANHLFGVSPEQLVGRNGLSVIHPDDQQRVFGDFVSIPNLGDHVTTEFRVILPDGQVRWVEETATNLLDEPDIGMIVGNVRDVTARREAEDSARFRATLLAAVGQAVVATDLDHRITYWNVAAEATYGWTAEEALGQDVVALLAPDEDWESVLAGEGAAERTHDESWSGEFRVRTKDGTMIPVMGTSTVVYDDSGAEIAAISVSTDITERHAAQVALSHQATHDALTGLPNRTSLEERLAAHLASTGDQRRRVAVAVLNLDRFKSLIDTVGHGDGDATLRAVGMCLSADLRTGDELFRLEGDEFIIVRPDVVSDDEATALGRDAARALSSPMSVGDQQFDLTASIGVAVSTDADTAASLLRDAGTAMSQAKADGRDRIVAFDAHGRARALRHLTLESDLHRALELDQLHLVFQPVLELASQQVAGFESLLRWDHPELGPVGPDEFIPIAETSGLILPIGDWVLRSSLEQLAAWVDLPDVTDRLWMAVNLSARQLGQPGLPAQVEQAITDTGVRADSVHLEITESIFVDHVAHAVEVIEALRALGAQISMDDFGTGYSSLSYLNRLPINTLKIDRSFMQGLGGDGNDTSIVRAIIALADSLGLDVVAEGVETEEQRTILDGIGRAPERGRGGGRFGQGYLWSRPLRPDDALAWLRAWPPAN